MAHHFEHERIEPEPLELPRTGMWGKVDAVDGDQVTVSVEDFDRSVNYFGPIPAIGETPVVGATAFLHFDQRDRPAYAVIFP